VSLQYIMKVTTILGLVFLGLGLLTLIFVIVNFAVQTLPSTWANNKACIGSSLILAMLLAFAIAGIFFYAGRGDIKAGYGQLQGRWDGLPQWPGSQY